MNTRPNILWYCTDQQRFDTIAGLGNRHIRTPNLDRLMARSVTFTRAYSQSTICTPSRATFLTGKYPAAHRVQRNGNDYFPAEERLITRILADEGYDCGLVGKLHLSRAKGRVERRPNDGYRFFKWSHHPTPDWPDGHDYDLWLREKGVDPQDLFEPLRGRHLVAGVPAELSQSHWCSERCLEFLSEKRSGPWLLSVNPFDPHPPFDPPPEYLDRYDPQDMPYPLFRESDLDHQTRFRSVDQQTTNPRDPRVPPDDAEGEPADTSVDSASSPPTQFDSRAIKAAYYAMIEQIDHEFGRILDFLEASGQLDNTIVIFTSDHGELLGDHGLLYKGCRFYEALVHVPLIISWPEGYRTNLRSDALVELVDLAPTILDALGPATPKDMQGKSLHRLLCGDIEPDRHKDHVVCEYYDAVDLPRGSHATMCFDGRYKSVLYHDAHEGEIFDLQADPGEFDDLFTDPEFAAEKAAILQKHCDALMSTVSAGVERSDSY